MTDDEVHRWKAEIETDQIKCFVTLGSDIESYFLNIEHLAFLSNHSVEDISAFMDNILRTNSGDIRNSFSNKRREINTRMHRDGGSPPTNELLPANSVPQLEHAVGKFILKKIRGTSLGILGRVLDPITKPNQNLCTDLTDLIESMYD